ncbi:transporter [Flavobacterium difficile]|uniref:Transporter n=1 Tax=Flavobacterium difficile TaxID=2709659 RepID=A0ABX0I7T5_9FLAO|nr:transporter [Flavobacterium difficile]NHM02210.1 transporter [Flavobacterium difficile]
MKQTTNIFLLATLLLSFLSHAQFTDEVNSNRPGKSMMAFSVGKSVFQTESGVNYITEDHEGLKYNAKGYNADFVMRWGVFKEELEVIAEIQYQKDSYNRFGVTSDRSALRQTVFGAKFLFYDPFKKGPEKPNLYSWKANHRFKWKQFIPAFSGYAGVNFNFSENNLFSNAPILEPNFSPKVMAIAQNHFGTRTVLVTNLIYNKIGTEFASIDYILTLTRGINQNWSAFIENQGYNGKYYSDGIIRLGAAFLHRKDMQFDASIGTNIKSTPSIFSAGIGFTWRFIKNYKEVKMAKPGTQSKMDKKMDKKAEKNKRKDGVE